jgi:AraC family transcriptional regulator
MRYIESHLDGDIDFEKVAQLACCSEYHFRRMFSFLSGMSLSEYIRRRRLSQAALELRHNNLKVIDVAIKYGYDSPDAFSRAFQALHGVTPTEAKVDGVVLKAIPPMTFQLIIQGENEMDYRIVQKEAFFIIGIKKQVTLLYEGVNPEITEMWKSLSENDIHELKSLSTIEPYGLVSGSINFTEGRGDGTQLDQYIGVATNAPSEKWDTLTVPASLWAVFTVRGKFPDEVQATWGRIYSEWLMMSEYEVGQGPEMLWNANKDITSPNFHSEIWIPIIKK